jgi:hypothetical protein
MLLESDVVEAVCTKLESCGYHILQKLAPTERGYDIIAEKRAAVCRKLYVEAKGEISSKRNSKRFGKPFNNAQISNHVARAFYMAAQALSDKPEDKVRSGIALPDTEPHRGCIRGIEPVLNQLGVAVFWVKEKSVQIVSTWGV